ncbi:TPA: phage scaffolding protein [Bacillus thuringiensis]|nr:phage scaffolding protein [Bacillus thuringiensis]
MKLEQLTEIGLTEEQAQQIIDIHKESLNGFLPKSRYDELNEKKKNLEETLKERDSQLENLKGINAEDLQAEITRLQGENEQAKVEYETKLHEQAYGFALKEALSGAKVRNHKALEALLNKEDIKLEEGKLVGLEDQLKALQESDSYLFDIQTEQAPVDNTPAPKFTVGNHNNEKPTGDDFTRALLGK